MKPSINFKQQLACRDRLFSRGASPRCVRLQSAPHPSPPLVGGWLGRGRKPSPRRERSAPRWGSANRSTGRFVNRPYGYGGWRFLGASISDLRKTFGWRQSARFRRGGFHIHPSNDLRHPHLGANCMAGRAMRAPTGAVGFVPSVRQAAVCTLDIAPEIWYNIPIMTDGRAPHRIERNPTYYYTKQSHQSRLVRRPGSRDVRR